MSIQHAQFTLERTYPAPREKVFMAFSSKERKAKWFGGGDAYEITQHEMDFRVGGKEIHAGRPTAGGPGHLFDAWYLEIVAGDRIVYAYNMFVGQRKLSSSLATIELSAAGSGTRLVMVEQGAFFDGADDPKLREEGTRELLERIALAL